MGVDLLLQADTVSECGCFVLASEVPVQGKLR